MNTLAALHSWMVSQLQTWPLAQDIQTLETEAFATDQFQFKLRAQLSGPFRLQIRFYFNRGHLDYAYQLFTDDPILRWDNKEDVGPLPTAPHHFHTAAGDIVESPLKGDPEYDWPLVRMAMEKFMTAHSTPPEQSN